MPTYDYRCKLCEHSFEHFQGMREPLLRKCPECGKPGLERLIGSGIGVVFKGSGFYETDYKRQGSKDDGKDKPLSKTSKDHKPPADKDAGPPADKGGNAGPGEGSQPRTDSRPSDPAPTKQASRDSRPPKAPPRS